MRLTIIVVLTVSALSAEPAQQTVPDGPVSNYSGYAYPDCGAANAPALRIVLPAGAVPVPAAVPKSPPRPAVELIVSATVEQAVGKDIAFVRDAAGSSGVSVVGLSCPVVGDCSRAQKGTLMLKRRDDGALTGEFRALWPDEAVRAAVVTGRFVAAWRDTPATCG
jgi:hypothetical protein